MSSLGSTASTSAERISFAFGKVGIRDAVSIGMLLGSLRLSEAISFAQLGRPLRRHPVMVGDRQRIVARDDVEPRQGAPRAADHVEWPAPPARAESGFLQSPGEPPPQILLRGRVGIAEAQDPEGQRDAGMDHAAADVGELEAAAAEIADQPVGVGEAREHALPRQPAFLLAGNHPRLEAQRPDLVEEGVAVAGVADGGGGEDSNVTHLHLADQQPEAAQGGERPGLRPLAEHSGLAQSLAEAGEHLFVEDDGRRPRRSGIDDEAHRVGADVDDRHRLGVKQGSPHGPYPHWPRRRRSFGTDPLSLSAAPRPERDGLVMK